MASVIGWGLVSNGSGTLTTLNSVPERLSFTEFNLS